MKLNTNLAKVLSDLAAVVEGGGINIDISINVNVAVPEQETSTSSQPNAASPESYVPDGESEPVIGPHESKEELENFLGGELVSEGGNTESDSKDAEAVPGAADEEEVKATSKPEVSVTQRSRPRPIRPAAPAAGSNDRCIKMVLQRQKQLSSMGVNVPDELMVAPQDEGEAQEFLQRLRPYLAS